MSTAARLPDPAPDGDALCAALDGELHEQRAAAREVFGGLSPMLMAPDLSVDQARSWTFDRLVELNRAGLGSAGLPRHAGESADPTAAVVAFETLAHGDQSVGIKSGVQFGLFGGAVINLGTDWHHDNFLPGITSLAIPGCFAMTELGHGSDVANLETTITFDHAADEFVVDSPTPTATKAYIGNAARDGKLAAVFGQLIVDGLRHGIHVVLVPIRDDAGGAAPGVAIGDQGSKGGLIGVDNGTISFDHVRVPRAMLLDRYGGVDAEGNYSSPIENSNRRFFVMLGTLVRGRVCIGAGAAIAARRALSIAVRYSSRRRQFTAPGRPDGVFLLDYLSHQRRLLPAVAKAYALGFAQNQLVARLVAVQGEDATTLRDQRELETRAAGLKAVTTWFANDAIQAAREACGGAGYMSENQLTKLRADTDVFATFEGDNTVLLQLVAKAVLINYKGQWGDLDMMGTVQATARLFGRAVIERTAARRLIDRLVATARRQGENVAVFDRGWQALMFEERERHTLESLAQRMRAASAQPDSFEAYNRVQDHLIFAGRVHMDRVILESFIAAIEAAPADVRGTLNQLCDLYALSSIEADRGWFAEHHWINSARSKAVIAGVNRACADLRPQAIALVDGLGIPEHWLGAAILG